MFARQNAMCQDSRRWCSLGRKKGHSQMAVCFAQGTERGGFLFHSTWPRQRLSSRTISGAMESSSTAATRLCEQVGARRAFHFVSFPSSHSLQQVGAVLTTFFVARRLRFTDAALRAVAQKAAKEGTGARALVWRLEHQKGIGGL